MPTVKEFAEALGKFIDDAKKDGIPLEDIINELEDIRDSIQEEVDEENPDPEEEEDAEKESD